jgi:hypothetical protein
MARANRHLASRPEKCQFCEVSGYLTGPLYIGGSDCNPIAYELRADGQPVGETLILILTQDGMLEAFLGPFHPSICETHTTCVDFGWPRIPLNLFNAKRASELVVQYLAAVTTRWPLGRRAAGEVIRNTERTIPDAVRHDSQPTTNR